MATASTVHSLYRNLCQTFSEDRTNRQVFHPPLLPGSLRANPRTIRE